MLSKDDGSAGGWLCSILVEGLSEEVNLWLYTFAPLYKNADFMLLQLCETARKVAMCHQWSADTMRMSSMQMKTSSITSNTSPMNRLAGPAFSKPKAI